MDALSIILGLLVLAGSTFFVIQPLLDKKLERQPLLTRQKIVQEDHQHSILMAERERILNALRELEQDHVEGKVTEEDYPEHRAALMQSGAEVLRQIDELDAANGKSTPKQQAAVAAQAPTPGEDELEALIAARRQQRSEKVVAFCGKCGHPLHKSDKFCPHCGAGVGD